MARSATVTPGFDDASLGTERELLGATLLSPAAFSQAAAIVTPEDFARDAHRVSWLALTRIHARGGPLDLVTLRNELTASGELEKAGGITYITRLTDGMGKAANVATYAQDIHQRALARELQGVLDEARTTFSRNPLALGNGAGSVFLERVQGIVAEAHTTTGGRALPADGLTDAVDVAARGRALAESGVPYVVDGIIPALGMVGFHVAYAKVGKSTLAQFMGACVACGQPFLGRSTTQARVLVLACEDPTEYTAYQARYLTVPRGVMTFWDRSLILTPATLEQIVKTVTAGDYRLVLISSWQAVVRGLVRDENDNAGAVHVVENVKAAARESGVPWLIDAHSGKGEAQDDDADPSKAMRGASGAAGAADFTLSLRYADGTFGTRRKLSGKGRFVSFPPITMNFDLSTGTYEASTSEKSEQAETTWRLLSETGAITPTPQPAARIAAAAGLIDAHGKVGSTHRRQVADALKNRPGVGVTKQMLPNGQTSVLYHLLNEAVS